MTPADLSTSVAGVVETSESGMTAKDLMLSRFPALMTAVMARTSSTRNAFIHRSMTAAHALEYCVGIGDHLVQHADVALRRLPPRRAS